MAKIKIELNGTNPPLKLEYEGPEDIALKITDAVFQPRRVKDVGIEPDHNHRMKRDAQETYGKPIFADGLDAVRDLNKFGGIIHSGGEAGGAGGFALPKIERLTGNAAKTVSEFLDDPNSSSKKTIIPVKIVNRALKKIAGSDQWIGFLNIHQAAKEANTTPANIYAVMKTKAFPKPAKKIGLANAWSKEEVEAWKRRREAGSLIGKPTESEIKANEAAMTRPENKLEHPDDALDLSDIDVEDDEDIEIPEIEDEDDDSIMSNFQ